MSDELKYEVQGPIARITLNRPDRLNALSLAMRRAWAEAIRTFNADPAVRVGILSGAGERAFSVGIDLKEFAQIRTEGKGKGVTSRRPLMPTKPIIAAINGYCLAGGFELALMCDIRLASAASSFGFPEVRRSLVPIHAVNLLPRLVSKSVATLLLLSGEPISAEKAARYGIIHDVLPDRESVIREAERLADALLLGAPLAVTAIRDLLWSGDNASLDAGYQEAIQRLHVAAQSKDAAEGARAFAEKRPPRWEGV